MVAVMTGLRSNASLVSGATRSLRSVEYVAKSHSSDQVAKQVTSLISFTYCNVPVAGAMTSTVAIF